MNKREEDPELWQMSLLTNPNCWFMKIAIWLWTNFIEMWPDINWTELYETITNHFNFWKLYTLWVPKMLMEEHKQIELIMLRSFSITMSSRATNIVIGNETWMAHCTPGSKRQSMQWRHTGSPLAKNLEHNSLQQKSWLHLYGIKKEYSLLIFWSRFWSRILIHFFQSINANSLRDLLKSSKRHFSFQSFERPYREKTLFNWRICHMWIVKEDGSRDMWHRNTKVSSSNSWNWMIIILKNRVYLCNVI